MSVKNAKLLKIGIVIDTNLDSNDGVQQYVKSVGAWLSDQGHQVFYLTSTSSISQWYGGPVISLSGSVRVRFNGNRLTIPTFGNRQAIHSLLQNHHFDVLHVQMPFSPLLAQRIIAAAPETTAIVGTFHILPVGRMQAVGASLLKLITRVGLKRFDVIVSVSAAAGVFARRHFGIESSVLPNMVDVKRYAAAKRPEHSGKKRIVYLGRLVERKGAMQLVKAFNILHADRQDVELIIASDGPLRSELERFIERHKLSDAVIMRGFIDEKDKPDLLASADIACFPSLYGESFGIVLIEAMAAGAKVVLGGDNPGYRSVLGEQPQLLVAPNDTALFAKRLNRLLDDSALITQLHTWQQATVSQYDTPVVGQRLLDLYTRVIAKKAGS